ncbi:hypothetical protein MNBD_PLANCTO03-451 [hydrothermal vent metagenome]|uniref:Endonuclease/exonuclease/phosphatase domain-containing protein n=1 Tax=hydrothermal vent metagenome TaxID=652676 RepID=A0A3B1DFQ7_9ZZZZ
MQPILGSTLHAMRFPRSTIRLPVPFVLAGALVLAALAPATAANTDGLRIVAWNVSNYGGGRVAAIQTSVYGEFEGRSMAPDAILLQEMMSAGGVVQFVQALNTAPGSPGDWAMAPFIDGNDTDNGFVYRTSKLTLLDTLVIAQGGPAPNHPRDVNRYDVQLVGYASEEATISLYSTHMKAGSGSSDKQRRLLEAQRIRADADALPDGRHFILGGDFNIQSSFQQAYIELTFDRSGDSGRFRDPIATPGSWNNNSSFRFVHTQDPAGGGGMDDRLDQVLISYTLTDSDGLDYIGDPTTPYATDTWDDPLHSYRSWGNDGSSYNTTLRIAGNTMVGPEIATALVTMAAGLGHLPVFLDLRVPARITAEPVLDFGLLTVGDAASQTITIGNAGDTTLWGPEGIGQLTYTLDTPAPYDAPAGPHQDEAGGPLNEHAVTLDTSAVGYFEVVMSIASNDPEAPTLEVTLRGNILAKCPADWDGNGILDTLDFLDFLNDWTVSNLHADLNADGSVNILDFLVYLNSWSVGC